MGAEEAFKILGHAFDLIGEAGKRAVYDRQLHEASEAEAAMVREAGLDLKWILITSIQNNNYDNYLNNIIFNNPLTFPTRNLIVDSQFPQKEECSCVIV